MSKRPRTKRTAKRTTKRTAKPQPQQSKPIEKMTKAEIIALYRAEREKATKAARSRAATAEETLRTGVSRETARFDRIRKSVAEWQEYASAETETVTDAVMTLAMSAVSLIAESETEDRRLHVSSLIRAAVPVLIERRADYAGTSSANMANSDDAAWSQFTRGLTADVQRVICSFGYFDSVAPKSGHVCKAVRTALQHGIDLADSEAIVETIGKDGWFRGHMPIVDDELAKLIVSVCEMIGL